MKKNKIKDTGLEVTELSFGTSSLGSMPDTYGYEVPEQRAQETLKRFFQGPVNMLDTSRNYAMGESEKRIGIAIKANDGWPEKFVLSTKIDRNMDTLALTDINGLWGFIKFVQCCKEADIYPIAGAHLITGTDEAIILVENHHGYQNLCRLLSNIHKQPNEGLKVNLGSNINGLFILSH